MSRLEATVAGTIPPPTLPPCDLRSGSIEAIYAGRFAIIQWADFCATATAAFGDRWTERTEDLRRATRARASEGQLQSARETYERLLEHARGRLHEEIAHHALLSQQPLWGFLNGVALAERLHLNHLEILLTRQRLRKHTARRALAHAFRCHLARRLLYREMTPVIEAMHAIDGALRARRPRLHLATFGTAYGSAAEAIAVAGYERVRAGELSPADLEVLLASVLAPSVLAPNPWDILAIGPQKFLLRTTRAADAALDCLTSGSPRHHRERSWSLISFLAWYLPRGNGGLVPGLVHWRLVTAYARALLPVARGLMRRAPYATTHADLPALWTHAPDGHGLILDPAALAYGANTLAHAGLENTNPLLPHNAAAESGYAIDQYLIRKAAEHLADPDGVWSHRLEDFLLRWTHAAAEPLREILRSVEPETRELAAALSTPEADQTLESGMLAEEAWEPFVAARTRLLEAVETEWRDRKYGPLATLLGSYYIHGL